MLVLNKGHSLFYKNIINYIDTFLNYDIVNHPIIKSKISSLISFTLFFK